DGDETHLADDNRLPGVQRGEVELLGTAQPQQVARRGEGERDRAVQEGRQLVQLADAIVIDATDQVPGVVAPDGVGQVVRSDVAGPERVQPGGQDGGDGQRAHSGSLDPDGQGGARCGTAQ